MQKARLYVISGPSGAGKGTICSELVKTSDLYLSVSMTTRAPRPGELEGVSYFFVNREQFEAKIASGSMLEYAEVYGELYGTPAEPALEQLARSRNVVLEIDVQGGMQVMEKHKDTVSIFILPPSMRELRDRITKRGSESEDAIRARLSKALLEIGYLKHYDYAIVNGELDEAVARVRDIIESGGGDYGKIEDAQALIDRYASEQEALWT